MGIAAWIVLIAVGVLFVACLGYLAYKKLSGKGGGCSSCGGNCSGCSFCGNCKPADKKTDREP